MAHDLIHTGLPEGSCQNWPASVFRDPASDAHLLPASPRPVPSCLDFPNLRPAATPCLLLAVRTCTTSLRKETRNCRPFRFLLFSAMLQSTFSIAIPVPRAAGLQKRLPHSQKLGDLIKKPHAVPFQKRLHFVSVFTEEWDCQK